MAVPSKAIATLQPEPTQHNSLDRLQIRRWISKTLLFMSVATLKGQTVGGDTHSIRIVFSVAADINSNVFDIYFLIWSLARLLCCVGSGFNVAAA